jgi:hypothetical protein
VETKFRIVELPETHLRLNHKVRAGTVLASYHHEHPVGGGEHNHIVRNVEPGDGAVELYEVPITKWLD